MPKNINTGSLATVLPLFLILFLDGMGLGILIPILNQALISPDSTFFMHPVSSSLREGLYGILMGVYMLCWFFGAAILGDLSDQVGRKKSLIICLIGTLLGFLINGFAMIINSYALLIIGRVIAGIASGSQPIAQAAVIDASPEDKKTRNIGFIILSICLGFTGGPVLAGFLSDHNIASWFNLSTPLFFGTLLSLLNIILLMITYKENLENKAKLKINWGKALLLVVDACKLKEIRQISISYIFNQLGWGIYFLFIATFMMVKFHLTETDISILLGVLGAGFSVGCAFLVNFLSKKLSNKISLQISLIGVIICVLLTLIVNNPLVMWIVIFFIGIFQAVAYSFYITLFSGAVDDSKQGWIMGVTSSLFAVVWGIQSLVMGFISGGSLFIPFIICFISFILGFIIMIFFRHQPSS
jgi:MFS transporter, DHA1 family, tetracycline resistance protein